MRLSGLEPETYGLKVRESTAVTQSTVGDSDCGHAEAQQKAQQLAAWLAACPICLGDAKAKHLLELLLRQ